MEKSIAKQAFAASIPVLSGYVTLGAGFGILLHSRGYGLGWALAMSLFIYAGSMQYLAVELLAGGAGLLTAAVTTLMVNARHLFYGISMIDKYRDAGWRKPYLIFALTDETYSLNCSAQRSKGYYFLVSLFNQCYWVAGSALGAILARALPFSTEGIDFSLTALFVTVFIDQWRSTGDHIPALVGLTASLAALVCFGADHFLIPAMLLITAALALRRRKEARHG